MYKQWLLGQPHDLRFQEFQYLRCLGIVLPWFNSNSLLTMLQKCPMLQDLTIYIDWVCLQETYSMHILFKHTFFSILKEALM